MASEHGHSHLTPAERGHRALREGGYAHGGHVDVEQDKAMITKALRQHENAEHGGHHEKLRLKRGGKIKGKKSKEHVGRQKRAAGGAIEDENADAELSPRPRPEERRQPAGDHRLAERHLPGDGEPSGRASGGEVDEGYEGSRGALSRLKDQDGEPDRSAKTYERTERARGGKTGGGKGGIGKVNIVIAHPGGAPGGPPGMPPPGGMPPPRPPMAPPMAAPPPGPGAGAPPMPPRPMGGPPMPPGGGGPMPPPGGMPMARPQGIKHGGHVRDHMGRFQGGGV